VVLDGFEDHVYWDASTGNAGRSAFSPRIDGNTRELSSCSVEEGREWDDVAFRI
jgi:hypothetical protein